ncbi:MAG: site-2 protease family protein [Patescibacteria group bacterium]|nr:site-2 protease family protein [Patescibacteria group bacterium]
MLISSLLSNPLMFVMWIVAILLAITIHEFAHAAAAFYLGDPTGKNMGRLTLNPLAHLDLTGTIFLFFVGFGWGKPVPFNPYNLKNQKWGPSLVALAGPASNLIFLILIGLIMRFVYPFLGLGYENALFNFLYLLLIINTLLMVFNLIPIPPLDGSKVLLAVIPDSMADFKINFERYGVFVLIALVFLGDGILTGIFDFFINIIHNLFIL